MTVTNLIEELRLLELSGYGDTDISFVQANNKVGEVTVIGRTSGVRKKWRVVMIFFGIKY